MCSWRGSYALSLFGASFDATSVDCNKNQYFIGLMMPLLHVLMLVIWDN